MEKDLRWLLVLAWPFGCLAVWQFLKALPANRTKAILLISSSISIGVFLL
jgi:hypothetical protein